MSCSLQTQSSGSDPSGRVKGGDSASQNSGTDARGIRVAPTESRVKEPGTSTCFWWLGTSRLPQFQIDITKSYGGPATVAEILPAANTSEEIYLVKRTCPGVCIYDGVQCTIGGATIGPSTQYCGCCDDALKNFGRKGNGCACGIPSEINRQDVCCELTAARKFRRTRDSL
jgi:hypothetical protein